MSGGPWTFLCWIPEDDETEADGMRFRADSASDAVTEAALEEQYQSGWERTTDYVKWLAKCVETGQVRKIEVRRSFEPIFTVETEEIVGE